MTDTNSKELVITRVFNAPVEKAWEAWTKPEFMKKWWGPKNFSAPTLNIDLKVGGKYLYCMRGEAELGKGERDFWSTGTYREITPPQAGRPGKLVCTDSFADEKGNIVPATHYGMEGFAMECEVTVIFEDAGNGTTKMTLHHKGLPESMMSDLTSQGWNQSFDKLVEVLK